MPSQGCVQLLPEWCSCSVATRVMSHAERHLQDAEHLRDDLGIDPDVFGVDGVEHRGRAGRTAAAELEARLERLDGREVLLEPRALGPDHLALGGLDLCLHEIEHASPLRQLRLPERIELQLPSTSPISRALRS